MTRLSQSTLRCFVATLVAICLCQLALGQPPRRRGARGGEPDLSKPFVGITNNGKLTKGLFEIRSTGVSTKPVVDAAKAFLNGLTAEQQAKTKTYSW